MPDGVRRPPVRLRTPQTVVCSPHSCNRVANAAAPSARYSPRADTLRTAMSRCSCSMAAEVAWSRCASSGAKVDSPIVVGGRGVEAPGRNRHPRDRHAARGYACPARSGRLRRTPIRRRRGGGVLCRHVLRPSTIVTEYSRGREGRQLPSLSRSRGHQGVCLVRLEHIEWSYLTDFAPSSSLPC